MRQLIESAILWLLDFFRGPSCSLKMLFLRASGWIIASLLAATRPAATKGLADIDHVILFMQGKI